MTVTGPVSDTGVAYARLSRAIGVVLDNPSLSQSIVNTILRHAHEDAVKIVMPPFVDRYGRHHRDPIASERDDHPRVHTG